MREESKENLDKEIYSSKLINGIKGVFFILAGIHLVYLFLFAYFKIYIMSAVNVASISIYLWMYYNITEERYLSFIRITFWEVIIHVIMCGLMIGEGTSFSVFCLVLLVGMRTSEYLYKRLSDKKLYGERYLIIASVAYIIFGLSGSYYSPFYGSGNSTLIEILDSFNSIVIVFAINYYIYITYKEIFRYENKLKEKNELLKKMSYIDSLTMLYNRRAIQDELKSYKEEKKEFSILLCDIDDFKNINDTYGHECGDMILREIATIIKDCAQGNGYAARWGGEEIMVLNEDKNSDAYLLAEKIRTSIENKSFIYEDKKISVTVTIGIGYNKEFSRQKSILMADRNLYIGKGKGKNVVIK